MSTSNQSTPGKSFSSIRCFYCHENHHTYNCPNQNSMVTTLIPNPTTKALDAWKYVESKDSLTSYLALFI